MANRQLPYHVKTFVTRCLTVTLTGAHEFAIQTPVATAKLMCCKLATVENRRELHSVEQEILAVISQIGSQDIFHVKANVYEFLTVVTITAKKRVTKVHAVNAL